MKIVSGGVELVGHADNPWPDLAGFGGYMDGYYYSGIGNGNRPDQVWLIHDANANGRILFEDSVYGLSVDPGDVFVGAGNSALFGAGDLLFGIPPGEIRDDVGQLPLYDDDSGGEAAILPHMIVSVEEELPVVPEPGALGLFGVALLVLRKRRQ